MEASTSHIRVQRAVCDPYYDLADASLDDEADLSVRWVQVPDAVVARWRAALAAWEQVQQEMAEVFHAQAPPNARLVRAKTRYLRWLRPPEPLQRKEE